MHGRGACYYIARPTVTGLGKEIPPAASRSNERLALFGFNYTTGRPNVS